MRTKKTIRIICWIICEVLAIATAVRLISGGMNEGLLLAMVTPFLLLLPKIAEKVLHCKVGLPIYIFSLLYALGPMLGQCWKLYYLTNWWDKALHISGGIMFTLLGWVIFQRLSANAQGRIVTAIFALCFSIAISAIWEFIEFGADQLLGMDMQNDTVVNSIISYELGSVVGVTGSICNIHQVSIYGIDLPFDGYLDIGLHDTMWDMILESVGALLTAISCCFSKKTHFGFYPKEK